MTSEVNTTVIFEGKRYYLSQNTNLWYPSVTSFLSKEKEEFFATWRNDPKNAGQSQKALDRGNDIHAIAEDFLLEKDLKRWNTNPNFPLFQQMRKYVKLVKPVKIETTLISDQLRLGGRSDCIGEYKGKLSIIDFKGSTKDKKEEWIEDYLLQTTCYSLMYEEMYKVKVPQIVILITCENGTVQEFVRNPKDYWEILIKRMKSYWNSVDFDALQSNIVQSLILNKGEK